MPELVDGPDLGSGAARRGGSSPPFPTLSFKKARFAEGFNPGRRVEQREIY